MNKAIVPSLVVSIALFSVQAHSKTSLETHLLDPSTCISVDNCPAGAYYFSPEHDVAQLNQVADIVLQKMEMDSEFSTDRYAFLLAPGVYTGTQNGDDVLYHRFASDEVKQNAGLNIVLGYYTFVHGLGDHPASVSISNLEVRNQCDPSIPNNPDCIQPGGLDNFWRGAENIRVHRTAPGDIILAASQAVPFRNLDIHLPEPTPDYPNPQLLLCDYRTPEIWACGYTSGGYMANVNVAGNIVPGSQQQYFVRNSEFTEMSLGALWNTVVLGSGERYTAPDKDDIEIGGELWDTFPYTLEQDVPIVAEKPFIWQEGGGDAKTFKLRVPNRMINREGVHWPIQGNDIEVTEDNFVIVSQISDPSGKLSPQRVSEINHAINNEGKHLLFMPGDYLIEDTIQAQRDGVIVHGIATTMVCGNAQACLTVSGANSKISGLTLDAAYVSESAPKTPALLHVQHTARDADLSDIACRVGGKPRPYEVQSSDQDLVNNLGTCLQVDADNVIIDHAWLWRADHGETGSSNNDDYIGWEVNKADHGIVVNGANVTAYGLFVEHFQHYQTLWNGENGRTFFYQSELPYDVPGAAAWQCDQLKGDVSNNVGYCASYKVADHVNAHQAKGLGVYSYFDDFQNPGGGQGEIYLANAIEVPAKPGMQFSNIIAVYLDGIKDLPAQKSGFLNIINNTGGPTIGSVDMLNDGEFEKLRTALPGYAG